MIKRHDIDSEVMNYVIESYTDQNNIGEKSFNSTYESTKGDIRLDIWKHSLLKDSKVELFIHKGNSLKKSYTFGEEASKALRQFFEELEDSKNQDYLRNEQKSILDLIF